MQVTDKQYAVWYSGGAGGYVIAWLLQLCVNPDLIDEALRVFPKELKREDVYWQSYEQVPTDIGLISNAFYSKKILNVDIIQDQVRTTLESIVHQLPDNFSKTLGARIKYYFVTYLWKKCWYAPENYDSLVRSTAFQYLKDPNYLKKITDPVFNNKRMVYVIAPPNFIKSALKSKIKSNEIYNVNNDILKFKDRINIFYTDSLWKGTYIKNLENILNRTLTHTEISACSKLCNRWLEIQPNTVKEYFKGTVC